MPPCNRRSRAQPLKRQRARGCDSPRFQPELNSSALEASRATGSGAPAEAAARTAPSSVATHARAQRAQAPALRLRPPAMTSHCLPQAEARGEASLGHAMFHGRRLVIKGGDAGSHHTPDYGEAQERAGKTPMIVRDHAATASGNGANDSPSEGCSKPKSTIERSSSGFSMKSRKLLLCTPTKWPLQHV